MTKKTLKNHIPRSPKECLEYQEHRERWTKEMQDVIDRIMKVTFPHTEENEQIVRKRLMRRIK